MRTNIIDDLRVYYVKHRKKMHQLLRYKKMNQICDAYFKDQLSYPVIAELYKISSIEVRNLMIKACGRMIRNSY